MYKEAIDVLMSEDIDFRAVAIQIAKLNPSVFVKAANAIGQNMSENMLIFNNSNGAKFFDRLNINKFIYQEIVNIYGNKEWLADVLIYIYGIENRDRPQKIKSIKLICASEGCDLKNAKNFMDDFVEGRFGRIENRIFYRLEV